MGVNRTNVNEAYGLSSPLIDLAPVPIVAKRNPTGNDFAELGTVWINQPAQLAYILVSTFGGVATWASSPLAGPTTLASLTVNPGNINGYCR